MVSINQTPSPFQADIHYILSGFEAISRGTVLLLFFIIIHFLLRVNIN
jgi:hypothetical protein